MMATQKQFLIATIESAEDTTHSTPVILLSRRLLQCKCAVINEPLMKSTVRSMKNEMFPQIGGHQIILTHAKLNISNIIGNQQQLAKHEEKRTGYPACMKQYINRIAHRHQL